MIPPFNKEKVDKLTLDQVVMKFFHVVSQVSIQFQSQLLFLYFHWLEAIIKTCTLQEVMLRSSFDVQSKEIGDEVILYQGWVASPEGKITRAQKLANKFER